MTRLDWELHNAYRAVFKGPDGKAVLKDILLKCGYIPNPREQLPPEAVVARRMVATHILSRLAAFTPTNLEAQMDFLTGLTPIGPGEIEESE
jgi:hypothetical protein